MQKHTLALGYFFLAVFCIYVRQNSSLTFLYYYVLQAVTVIALIVGGTFFLSAFIEQVRECKAFLAKWIYKAQQPPSSESESTRS